MLRFHLKSNNSAVSLNILGHYTRKLYTSASKNSLCLVICARLPHFYYLDSIGIESPLHFIEVVSEEEHESEVFSNSLESIQVLHHRFQDCYTSLSVPSHPLHFNEVEHEDKSPTSVST